MKLTHYLNNIDVKTGASFKSGASLMVSTAFLACASLAMLTACSDEIASATPTYTVGEADNAIVLSAGISEGGSGVQTRAGEVIYKAFNGATQLRLRIDGTWLGHTPTDISQNTTATTAASATIDSDNDTSGDNGASINDTHTLDYVAASGDKKLYWDDYGTADPANMSTVDGGNILDSSDGRSKGLTIYGVAVDGKSTLPTPATGDTRTDLRLSNTGLDWANVQWNVGTPEAGVISQTSGWSDYDLLTSNNVTAETGANGTYKFNDRASGKLLKFTHAMTKITVNLTAGEGFPDYSSSDATAAKFKNNPSVTLKNFNYMGKVDVINKTSTATKTEYATVGSGETAAKSNVAMYLGSGGASSNTAKFEALVFPGNKFTATIAEDANKTLSSNDPLLELNADGNIYKVTAAQLVKAIAKKDDNNTEPGTGDYEKTLERGVNYVINITVNKTEITVTATVKDWETVTADEEAPVINVNTEYNSDNGATPDGFTTFSFYRSASNPFADPQVENILTGYSSNNKVGDYYAPEGMPTGTLNSSAKWDFGNGNTLYWPTHDTHYHFRGVWPTTSTETGNTATVPHVKMNSISDAQVIDIKNVAYSTTANYPSNLMIGMPVFTDANKNCNNDTHNHFDQSKFGICATGGLITLNFKYVMSQVEVRLKTSTGNDKVSLTDAVVEIVNGYKDGYVKLGNREIVVGTKENYTLDNLADDDINPRGPDDDKVLAANIRHSAIVPQEFIYSTEESQKANNTRFKITVTNSDNTTDVYYADIKPIKKKGTTTDELVAPNGKWESGVHYIYTLHLTKTEIKVTATLTDWVTVKASDDVWF